MEISGTKIWKSLSPTELLAKEGGEATLRGTVHNIRALGGISFVIVRTGRYLFQCVWDKECCKNDVAELAIGDSVEISGTVKADKRVDSGVEILLSSFKILNSPPIQPPLNLADATLKATLGTKMEYRTVALRHPKERAVFRLSEGIGAGFREFMHLQGFAEIHSPKIVGISAEGGAEVFKLDYFGQKATLSQSPQFYKQTCVAFFDRVYEIGAVYRAELHNTARHLNEYIGLDFEMGFIDSMYDVMEMETAMLRFVFEYLAKNYAQEVALLDVDMPVVDKIPSIRFSEARELLKTLGGGKKKTDLTPEDEVLLCSYFKEKGEGDFVFVTHFPGAKRPFYVMDDEQNPELALSFDLLFRGLEITTGGQRIHKYQDQVAKLEARGLNPEDFESYIGVHRVGLPPHGGLGIGLERLTMKLCGLSNIRDASLFPRDITHLYP